MKTKVIAGMLGLLLVVAVWLYMGKWREVSEQQIRIVELGQQRRDDAAVLQDLRQQIASGRRTMSELERRVRNADRLVDQLNDRIGELVVEAKRLRAEGEARAVAAETPQPDGAELSAAGQRLLEAVGDVEVLKRIHAGLRNMTRKTASDGYADFLAELAVPESVANELGRYINLRAEAYTPEAAEHYAARIRDILGEEAYRELKSFEKTIPLREFLNDFDKQLSTRGQPGLSEAQRQGFLGMPPEVLKEIRDLRGDVTLNLGQLPSGGTISEAVDQSIDQSINRFNTLITQAGETLTPEQLKALDAFLGERLAAKESGAQMAAALLPSLLEGIEPGEAGPVRFILSRPIVEIFDEALRGVPNP